MPQNSLRSLLLIGLVLLARSSVAQEPAVVRLSSGRTFTAWIDERTNDATLWLRFQTRGISVYRPVEWNRVVSAEYGGASMSGEQLRAMAATVKSSAKSNVSSMTVPEVIDIVAEPRLAQPASASIPQVSGFTIDAELGNWDQDEPDDGIVVWLTPQDAWGRNVEFSGHVEVRLFAPLTRRFHEAPTLGGASLEPIGQWTCAITPNDFTEEGVRLLLPFQAFDPDHNERVGSFGMIQVKLIVPGQGVYQRSMPLVRLRPFSPLRDRFGALAP